MGIDPGDFVARYPRVWHMAEADSWPSIVRHGLLSTSALLDLYEITGEEREVIEGQRRATSVRVTHPELGEAIIRDQKPVIESVLRKTLDPDTTLRDFYVLLNKRVFFWVREERLDRLRNAGAYRDRQHLVLTIDTAGLVERYEDQIRLSHLNSGATHPAANYPRGRSTFQPLATYPWEARTRQNPTEPVVEIAVNYSVPDITDLVLKREIR